MSEKEVLKKETCNYIKRVKQDLSECLTTLDQTFLQGVNLEATIKERLHNTEY